MIVYARTRWSATLICVLLGALALMLSRLRAPGLVLAASAVVPILVLQRMRLSADASGVTVVNLLRARHVEWSEIADFQMGRVALSACLDVCERDGRRVHAWVVTTTGRAAYPSSRVESVISDLRGKLMLANGWSQADLDARAIEAALAAADRGEYRQASTLVADGRVDPRGLAVRLVKCSRENRRNAESEN
jgi:hypothetical protein